jgi:Raf kinase inhibitor-like YbhB/YbcL family protein
VASWRFERHLGPAVGARLAGLAGLAGVVATVTVLGACDTGDGKTLQPYDAADYPSQTSPPTSVTESFDVSGAGMETPTLAPVTVPAGSTESFAVFAPWQAGAMIDVRNTCDGANIAPALSWGSVPTGTREIAVALVDDSAVSEGQPFVHWVIAGIDPGEIALVEGDVPSGATQALNFFGDVGYGGPCPPPGDDPHLYRLTAYALSAPSGVSDGTPAVEFLDALEPLTLATTDVSGTYGR